MVLGATRYLLGCLAVNLVIATAADAGVTRHETVTTAQEGNSPLVLPAISGGTDQTYVLFIATRGNDDVAAVTGGGLTWIEQVEQCSGRDQQGIRLWTAQGSPGPFQATVTWDDGASNPIVAILTRYSSVGSVGDPTGENTHGEGGDCSDGNDSGTARLTLTSSTAGPVHVVGVNSRNKTVTSFSADYGETGSEQRGSGGELTILTTYDRPVASGIAETFEAGLSGDVDWCTAGAVLNPVAVTAGPNQQLVTSTGVRLLNAELLWVRARTPSDTLLVTIGYMLESALVSDQWLYFLTSECFDWSQEVYSCLESELHVELSWDVEYDLVVWSEAADRIEPDRDMLIVAQRWRYHPGDVDLDGRVSCADIDFLAQDTYDWNLDGEVTEADVDDLTAVVSAASLDLDGNGVVDEADMAILIAHWGQCPDPQAPCPGDVDCDGVVGIMDYLLMINGG